MNEAIWRRLHAVPAHLGAVYLDLNSQHCWSWNAWDDFPAASVIKVPILVGILSLVQQGQFGLQERLQIPLSDHVGGAGVLQELHDGVELTVEDLCRLMIVVSDNVASNRLLDRWGDPAPWFERWNLFETVLGRRFMEAPGPGRDNRTSPWDMARLLRELHAGQLLDAEHTEAALSIMRRQQYREKIPLMLPPEVNVAHKTGELEGVRHDMGIVEVPEHPYVLVLLSERGQQPWEVDRALAELSLEVYHWHLKRLRLNEGAAGSPSLSSTS